MGLTSHESGDYKIATVGKSPVHFCVRLGTEAGVPNSDLTSHISQVNVQQSSPAIIHLIFSVHYEHLLPIFYSIPLS